MQPDIALAPLDTVDRETIAALPKKLGWKRKSGPIKNLELVQELYALSLERPGVQLKGIAAHSGNRWNET